MRSTVMEMSSISPSRLGALKRVFSCTVGTPRFRWWCRAAKSTPSAWANQSSTAPFTISK
ncbi:MAG: hypothetical protein WDM92_08225 [Caulobacteraceae bacterium]